MVASRVDGLTRRDLLKKAAAAAAGAVVGSAVWDKTVYVSKAAARTITVGVGGWAVDAMNQIVRDLGFTRDTGIQVNIQVRPGAPPEFISQMASAVNAGTSPYDVVDIEDEAAITLSRLGWLEPLDGLLTSDFWEDFSTDMLAMVEVWHRYRGETFRIPHNYEAQYFWYRKDWFDREGLRPPQTWAEMVEAGKRFTRGDVWGVSDGLAKGAYLNVFVGYLTLQAGGNIYEFGEPARVALKFLYDMIYTHRIFPIAALNKDYDALNVDYMNDRVAMMRQWPYFWDVSRGNQAWWREEKTAIAVPPAGPGGHARTYAAAWGWVIPRTAPNKDAAREFVRWIVSKENAPRLAAVSTWFLSARKSVLDAVGDQGIAPYLRQYSEAGIIGTRPFHPRYFEAVSVVEDLVSAYLTNQMSLDDVIRNGRDRIARLGGMS